MLEKCKYCIHCDKSGYRNAICYECALTNNKVLFESNKEFKELVKLLEYNSQHKI